MLSVLEFSGLNQLKHLVEKCCEFLFFVLPCSQYRAGHHHQRLDKLPPVHMHSLCLEEPESSGLHSLLLRNWVGTQSHTSLPIIFSNSTSWFSPNLPFRCWSYLGRQGGEQLVSLRKNGCLYHSTVQHEVNHALGFHHEQVRSDRDNYVQILTKNIIPGWLTHNWPKTLLYLESLMDEQRKLSDLWEVRKLTIFQMWVGLCNHIHPSSQMKILYLYFTN